MTRINGSWFGPGSYYMNHMANAQYAAQAVNGARATRGRQPYDYAMAIERGFAVA